MHRLSRDKNGSIGVQITEGCDGGVYVQSVATGGSADKLGLIHKGNLKVRLMYKYYSSL